jgi:hypothetical protein
MNCSRCGKAGEYVGDVCGACSSLEGIASIKTNGKKFTSILSAIQRLRLGKFVAEIDHDEDGYWVYLNQGAWSDAMDCRTIHEDTIRAINDQLKDVRVLSVAEQGRRK